MLTFLGSVVCVLVLVASSSFALNIAPGKPRWPNRDRIHLPLQRAAQPTEGAEGVGDVLDSTYNVQVQLGNTGFPLILDTGSADLWVLADSCVENCATPQIPLYQRGSFRPTGIDVNLQYGDSSTGTFADGPIGQDTAGLAQLTVPNQYFVAVNKTNTNIPMAGSGGILGLGFPLASVIWSRLFQTSFPQTKQALPLPRALSTSSADNNPIRVFPNLSFIRSSADNLTVRTAVNADGPTVEDAIATFSTNGPLIPRLIASGTLAAPLVAITLQRDIVDIGGNVGMLSIGAFPRSVDQSKLTWAPVRRYSAAEGGLAAPVAAPDEVYPLTWEVPVDDVYFDGQKLPRSNLSSPNVTLSALVDTGNSLIRGPRDVVNTIIGMLGGTTYDCSQPHSLAFQINGTLFAVDPRDFGAPTAGNSTARCSPSLAIADPPGSTFLYSWNLGDPFLKSVLVSLYYGNLTYPSSDPPRMGFLSTVPADAGARLQSIVAAASSAKIALPATSDSAATGAPTPAGTDSVGVPQASEISMSLPSGSTPPSSAAPKYYPWTHLSFFAFWIVHLGLWCEVYI
ncbi:acid protease [Dentipellis sp. KUC8613]|nr:acid protease [Dentipellis sp. KUC8613]